MVRPVPIPIGVQSYDDQESTASIENLINLFAEKSPSKSPIIAKQSPGLSLYASVGSGPYRGEWEMNGKNYVVSGEGLYEGDTAGVYTFKGTIPGTGRVGMASNDRDLGPQLMIVNGTTTGYVYTATGGLTSVSLTGPAYTVVYQDGYFIFDWTGTGKWFISNVNNGKQFDSTEVGATNARPDNVLAVVSKNQLIWVWGDKTAEIYENNPADVDFPWRRINEVTVDDVGLGSRDSLVYIDDTLYLVGSDREVYHTNGYELVMITDPTIADALESVDIPSITAFAFKWKTHVFYQINLPNNKSYRFDARTRLWHRVTYWNNGHKRHRGETYCYFNYKHLVGDYENGNLYEFVGGASDDNGQFIRREMITPMIHANQGQLIHGRLIADFKMGVGNVDVVDPAIVMEFSEDAEAWSKPTPGLLGKTGQRSKQLWWDGLGAFYQRAYKIWWTDKIDTSLIGLYAIEA